METKFKVGDKVKCVDNNFAHLELTLGKEYEIVESHTETVRVYNDANVLVKHYSDRFELVKPETKAPVTFKTQSEIFQALLEGKKITANNGKNFIQMVNGFMKDQNGVVRVVGLNPPDWTIYEEAPVATEPEKIEVYQWRWRGPENSYWVVGDYLMTEDEADRWFREDIAKAKHAGPFYVTKPEEVK